MAHLAIAGGYSVNGVAKLHTEILEKQELKDFYECIRRNSTIRQMELLRDVSFSMQIRCWLPGSPTISETLDHKPPELAKLKVYADDKRAQQEFMNIKHQNKVRLAKYILEHNGIEVDPNSIFDVQVKRLHEYKRQLMNILHVMYLYNKIKEHRRWISIQEPLFSVPKQRQATACEADY